MSTQNETQKQCIIKVTKGTTLAELLTHGLHVAYEGGVPPTRVTLQDCWRDKETDVLNIRVTGIGEITEPGRQLITR